jgi:SAM-dependent methyltransferase
MGLATHELLLLKRVSAERHGDLGEVLTIGRQWLSLGQDIVDSIIGRSIEPSQFADTVFHALGASAVVALDASGYEGAGIVHDLNLPYEGSRQFDCVVDFGSLEHVFDIAMAFRTIAGLARTGGSILHVLPANNLLSHGFWQISADVLLELYCTANGFEHTEVYYASNLDTRTWWQVLPRGDGERQEVASVEPIIVLCKTVKSREVETLSNIQQPFYRRSWEAGASQDLAVAARTSRDLSERLRKVLRSQKLYCFARNLYHLALLAAGRSPYGLTGSRFVRVRTGL